MNISKGGGQKVADRGVFESFLFVRMGVRSRVLGFDLGETKVIFEERRPRRSFLEKRV